jgi:hypothetical protein
MKHCLEPRISSLLGKANSEITYQLAVMQAVKLSPSWWYWRGKRRRIRVSRGVCIRLVGPEGVV